MNYCKITEGLVIQTFNDRGECLKQEFVAGDQVSYETDEGDQINSTDMPYGGNEYHSFDMTNPNAV